MNKEPLSPKTNIKENTRIEGTNRSSCINVIKAIVWLREDQGVDIAQKNMELELQGQPIAEVLLRWHRWYRKYKTNEHRINFRNSLLFQKRNGETDSIEY